MKKSLIFSVILLLLAGSSCSLFSSSSPAKQYYQIYYKPAATIGKKISGTVRVKTFDVDKIYRRHNIVYRKSMYEMYYYNTQFWASKPADMITDVFAKHLSETELFSDVILELERRPDYVLTGRLLALDEIQSDEKTFARVSIVFELKDYKTDRSIVTHSFEKRKEVKNKETVYVVRAMGEIIEEETDIFFNKLYEALNID